MRARISPLPVAALLAAGCSAAPTAGSRLDDTVQADPSTISFGEVAVGERREATVALTTRSAVPIRVLGSFVEADGVARVATGDVPPSVSAGDGAEVRVVYESARAGRSAGKVVIEFDSTSTPRREIPFDGHTAGPFLECDPGAIDFDQVPVGQRREAAVRCTNTGYAADGNPAYVLVQGATSTAPEVAASIPAGDLAVGGTVDVAIRFEPRDEGALEATVALQTEPGGLAPPIVVAGSGVTSPCDLDVQVDPGVAPPGDVDLVQLRIRNRGSDACRLDGLSWVATCGTFTGLDSAALPPLLPGGETATLDLWYRPLELGQDRCELALDARPPQRITVTGECTYRECLALPAPDVEFGTIAWTCPLVREVGVANRCGVLVPVSVALEGEDSGVFSLVAAPTQLDYGTTLIPVTFRPPRDGTFGARIAIRDPEGGGGNLSLSGTGEAPLPPRGHVRDR
jgi:hypothetical protein